MGDYIANSIQIKIMARTEVLKEWFFPSPVKRDGSIIPAPNVAAEKYRNLRDGWLRQHPDLPHENPRVSMDPVQKEGITGYSVRTEIVYK